MTSNNIQVQISSTLSTTCQYLENLKNKYKNLKKFKKFKNILHSNLLDYDKLNEIINLKQKGFKISNFKTINSTLSSKEIINSKCLIKLGIDEDISYKIFETFTFKSLILNFKNNKQFLSNILGKEDNEKVFKILITE